MPAENKIAFIHPWVLAMTRPPNRKPGFPIHSKADREYTPGRLHIERFSPDFPAVRFSRQNTWQPRHAMCTVCDVLWRRRPAGVFTHRADQKNRRRDAGATKNQSLLPSRWHALYRSGLP
jgi:hypothetical protein